MTRLAALLLLLAPLAAAAQTAAQTFKCTDGRNAVTYSSEPCAKLGLKDAGPISNRITTMQTEPLPVRKLSPKREPEKNEGEKKSEPAK